MTRNRAGDDSAGDRGVSEVISVVLMVAVTIVLAAMVGTVLLNIVGGVETNPIAGVSIDANAETNEITVTYTANQKQGTTLTVEVTRPGGTTDTKQLTKVGQSATFPPSGTTYSDGTYEIKVIAEGPGGKQAVIRNFEVTI